MEKYIKNYVWHGVFDKLDTRCTTWMTGTVAGLRRKEGGLAVPNLRAELLALSAVTVSRWGSSATKTSLLIGEVLLRNGKKHECAAQKLTMGWTRRRVTGFAAGSTLWAAGRCVLGEHAGSGHHGEHVAQVARFYSHIEKQVPTSLLWDDTSCEIDLTAMLRSELLTIRNYFATHYESVQIVWLPYLNLNNFPLFTPTGVIKPGAEMKVMWGRGIVGSILGWHKTSRTKLTFTAKDSRFLSALRPLIVALIANFPEILYNREQATVIPVTTTPPDTPFEVHTRPSTTSDGGEHSPPTVGRATVPNREGWSTSGPAQTR
ncbi:uncharacterized protein CCR75_008068 [Bremia lactucae]|uniref:Uncharacterized protein n=1 Tax=Bremia lactucae TaxID=4779 RepID=A0A976FE89_BRELC|nr:hypothetical protein CCR75_008068 [Bremia lactucae]